MNCKIRTKQIWKVIAMVMAIVLAMPGFSVAFADETTDTVAAVYGDVNADTIVNAEDALEVLKAAAKLQTLDETQKIAADVNGDKIIDAADALLILQMAATIIDKFPIEDVDPTDEPVPTESEEPVPTESEEPVPTESDDPVPTESDEPVPTHTNTVEVIDNAYIIKVKDAGEVADVESSSLNETVTFKDSATQENGVLLDNPFIGKDTTSGAAISFFMTSPVDIKPGTSSYISIISIVNAAHEQILKYDMEGTRQLATIPTPKLNYWAASLSIKAYEEYFITLVAKADGLHYYINGTNIGKGDYAQIDETKGREAAMAIFSGEGAELYLGGTVNVPDAYKDMCKNKVPAGTIVRDIVGYVGELTDEDVAALYEIFTTGTPVIPTPGTDDTPTDTPVPTESDEPVPTESEEPTPTESEEPTPSEDISTESVVAMEVKELNGAATVEDGVITFVETESTNGVLMANPFANRELEGGGSISFWYTPSVDTKAAGLITLVNYTDLLQFARFNDDGTMQFRDAYSTQIYNVWSVDTKFEAGTSYFMTAVMSDDGIKYYANGEPIVITATDGNPGLKNEAQIKDAIIPLITNPNTNFYLGGTTNIWEKMVASTTHALPAGLEIKDVKAHMSALTAEEIKALYDEALKTPEEETPTPSEDPVEPSETPVEPVNVISNLEVKDETYGSYWSIDTDLQIGDLVFGDRDVTFVTIDEALIGAEYIVTSCDSKKTTTDLAVVTAGKDMTLYVGFDNRVTTIPEWAAGFTKTEMVCVNNKDVTFVIYQIDVKAGESITLGAQGQSAGCVGYMAMAKAK